MPRKRAVPVPQPEPKPSKLPTLDHAADDQLYPVEYVANFLAISDWMVRKHIKSGRLPVVFIDGMYRVRAADLRDYVARQRHTSQVLNNAS